MEFRLPEIGEGLYEAEVSRWLVKPGEAVQSGQGLLEVLTDKATMEVPAPFAGTIGHLLAEVGQTVKVGQPILDYQQAGAPAREEPAEAETKPAPARTKKAIAPPAKPAPRNDDGNAAIPVKAAPSVRQMARSLGIDLSRVHGSGPAGRILIEDLAKGAKPHAEPHAVDAADYGKAGTRVKFHGVRRKIAEHLVAAMQKIPHYTYVDECDVSDLVRLRGALKEPLGKQGVRVTYLPFLVKAVVAALKDVPIVNASLDEAVGEIVLHDRYHIGVAVATANGLIVPVIRDADRLPFTEVAHEIERLGAEARAGKVKLDDLKGGTFTITSIGNIGGLFATPILNHPQLGILGVGKIVRRPVLDEHGRIKPADMVYLSMTFDHRVLDGAVGAAFGNALMRRLKNPAALLLSNG